MIKTFEKFNWKFNKKKAEEISSIKPIKKKEIEVGDFLLCEESFGYQVRTQSLPRTRIFLKGKYYRLDQGLIGS